MTDMQTDGQSALWRKSHCYERVIFLGKLQKRVSFFGDPVTKAIPSPIPSSLVVIGTFFWSKISKKK